MFAEAYSGSRVGNQERNLINADRLACFELRTVSLNLHLSRFAVPVVGLRAVCVGSISVHEIFGTKGGRFRYMFAERVRKKNVGNIKGGRQ